MTPERIRRIPQVSDDSSSEYLRLRRARKHGDIAALVAALEDPVWAATASRFLGQIQAKEAAPAIAQLLESSQPHIRIAAVEALGELGIRDDAGSVERLARSDSHQAVRAYALVALAQILGPEARGVIGSALEKDPDWRTRRAAAVALGLVGTREDWETLNEAAKGEPWLKRRRYRQARRQIRRRNRKAAV
jgi:HEAT repeat protein